MSDNLSRTQKIAAARKKLKEYQSKDKPTEHETPAPVTPQIEEEVVKQSESRPEQDVRPEDFAEIVRGSDGKREEESPPLEVPQTLNQQVVNGIDVNQKQIEHVTHDVTSVPNDSSQVNVIQVLISEKAALLSELTKFQTICKEKDFQIEELSTLNRRVEDLERNLLDSQKHNSNLQADVARLSSLLEEKTSQFNEQAEYLEEVTNGLKIEKSKNQELQNSLKETSNELELCKIRINQISDEASITTDNRVETLTQTVFRYEQQIRDLQAMVQTEKEQTSQQYQNYVQHLNTDISSLSEKNTELIEEVAKLQAREKGFIDHIAGLERQIQQSMAKQDQLNGVKDIETVARLEEEIENHKRKIDDLESERLEFVLKVKSQDDELNQLKHLLTEKNEKIEELEERTQSVSASQGDYQKLLGTLESDKIAASRAMTQNNELKQQLDELQIRFIQLTNDKVELTTRLDSEEFANREIRANYKAMEEQLAAFKEKLHFKDEEMIRLSHENNELVQRNDDLTRQIARLRKKDVENNPTESHSHAEETEHHNHDTCDHHHDENHEESSETPAYVEKSADHANCNESDHEHGHSHAIPLDHTIITDPIPTTEAVEKLQHRFTKLMKEVADLTDEKQRLEHLVLVLQNETETIGEYIALYQTQRRILKQREYEKAAQLQRLQVEREDLLGKITTLNKLVSTLGVGLPIELPSSEIVQGVEPSEDGKLIEDIDEKTRPLQVPSADRVPADSKVILTKIQDIIAEIKENTKEHSLLTENCVDHCSCCSGKFETV